MKALSLTLFFALICSYGFAQKPASLYTPKIDSLQNLLNKNPKEDTIKVKRLNDLALLCSFDMQFTRGIIAAKQARQLSKKLDYPKGEGLYLIFMQRISGGTSFSLGYFYSLKKTLWYDDIKEKEEPNKLEELFPQKSDPEKVIAKLSEALKSFEKDNDKDMMAHILVAISANYQMLNKTNESIEYADRAIKLFKEAAQPEHAFTVMLEKIYILNQNKKTNEVIEVENDAKAIIANIKDVREKELLNFLMGRMYINILPNKKALGFEYLLKADYELEKIGEKNLRILVLTTLGFDFDHVGMYQKAVDYFNKAIELRNETKQFDDMAFIHLEVVFELVPLKKFNEAKQYLDKARSFASEIKDRQARAWFEARTHDASGQLLMEQGKYQEALVEYFQANKMAKDLNDEVIPKYFNSYIAQCYQKLGNWEKSIFFGEKSYKQILKSGGEDWLKINTSLLLSEVYEATGQSKKAFEYLKKYKNYVKEKEEQDIANLTTNLAIENFTQKNEQEKAALEKEKLIIELENKNQRWWLFSIAAALLSSFIFLLLLYRTNQNKQKANNLLSRQKEEINLQRDKAEKALSQLKSTQAQLIQSEKMASLGELTAGIAHEIQNPLNFVNNFSEVSEELIEEVLGERLKVKGERDEALEGEILVDIKENLSKIHHHGNRASSIVKGMLEHSRTSSGEKELTDINALADEYVRLAYHGLRAKDKDFNAEFETQFDSNLPKIEVIPQDIDRVLLNLINNAFQAVDEQSKKEIKGYKPSVSVSTHLMANSQLLITIKDNGPGIPDSIKDKIFQPFFTTKDTGKGTGLGLSLAYDIVKAHDGEITVATNENEGASFTIKIPVS